MNRDLQYPPYSDLNLNYEQKCAVYTIVNNGNQNNPFVLFSPPGIKFLNVV